MMTINDNFPSFPPEEQAEGKEQAVNTVGQRLSPAEPPAGHRHPTPCQACRGNPCLF